MDGWGLEKNLRYWYLLDWPIRGTDAALRERPSLFRSSRKRKAYIFAWRERRPYVQQWLHRGKGLISSNIVSQPCGIRNEFGFFFRSV